MGIYYDKIIEMIPAVHGTRAAYLQHEDDGTFIFWTEDVVAWALCESYDQEHEGREVRGLIMEGNSALLWPADHSEAEPFFWQYINAGSSDPTEDEQHKEYERRELAHLRHLVAFAGLLQKRVTEQPGKAASSYSKWRIGQEFPFDTIEYAVEHGYVRRDEVDKEILWPVDHDDPVLADD